MLLLDLSHTSHTRAQTGIQRVARALLAAVRSAEQAVQPVCYDPYLGAWRSLDAAEEELAEGAAGAVAGHRGAHWPWQKRLEGRTRRMLGQMPAALSGDGLVCPELFSPAVARHLPDLFAVVTGPRVAVFHDAIALRFPELTPTKTVARFPAYLQELACFDGIAAISEDSAACLRDYWAWLGFRDTPPIAVFQPGLALPPAAAGGSEAAPGAPPVVLSVGSIEGRKNHRALLDACEGLWREGQKFELQLIGLAQPATGAAALARIRELQSAGRPLRYAGPLPDAMLQAAYADCAFTVYPSLVEGFGLPVIESLAHGKPCICSGRGALGEVARDGGCLALEKVEAADLEAALRRLLENPAELARLAASARARTFRSWRDYQTDLHAWMRGLSRRC